MNPFTDMAIPSGTLPGYAFPELLPQQISQVNEPHGWFYCMPHFRQAFAPALNSVLNEKLPPVQFDNCKEAMTPKSQAGCSEKRFLVFDQSGDQTTLVFSSRIGTPIQCPTSWSPKPTIANNMKREDLGSKENLNPHLVPSKNDEFGEINETDLQSEMHEDTEELNALLYSDDDSDYTDDEEVTSTGHSPSTMTAHNEQDWFEGSTEEVASSDGSAKKRKLSDVVSSDIPSLIDTASSMRPIRGLEYEDDAESKCVNDMNLASDQMVYESSNKRMRKDKIRETLSILQNIIPGGKGKDAIVVLDEAITFLKSLKLKAKALGLGAS